MILIFSRYIPAALERKAAEDLLSLFCQKSLSKLTAFAKKELDMEKEELVLHLKTINGCMEGASELISPLLKEDSEKTTIVPPFAYNTKLRMDLFTTEDLDLRHTVFKVNF